MASSPPTGCHQAVWIAKTTQTAAAVWGDGDGYKEAVHQRLAFARLAGGKGALWRAHFMSMAKHSSEKDITWVLCWCSTFSFSAYQCISPPFEPYSYPSLWLTAALWECSGGGTVRKNGRVIFRTFQASDQWRGKEENIFKIYFRLVISFRQSPETINCKGETPQSWMSWD